MEADGGPLGQEVDRPAPELPAPAPADQGWRDGRWTLASVGLLAMNMQKIIKYAQYAIKTCKTNAKNMQNMHKSMYWHILHIHALPTLLISAFSSLTVLNP